MTTAVGAVEVFIIRLIGSTRILCLFVTQYIPLNEKPLGERIDERVKLIFPFIEKFNAVKQ